jgi:hypothetical protein
MSLIYVVMLYVQIVWITMVQIDTFCCAVDWVSQEVAELWRAEALEIPPDQDYSGLQARNEDRENPKKKQRAGAFQKKRVG